MTHAAWWRGQSLTGQSLTEAMSSGGCRPSTRRPVVRSDPPGTQGTLKQNRETEVLQNRLRYPMGETTREGERNKGGGMEKSSLYGALCYLGSIDLSAGILALAWFPASWASKIAPLFFLTRMPSAPPSHRRKCHTMSY